MFEAFRIGVAIHLTNHVSPVLTKLTTEFARTGAEAAAFQKRLEGIKSTMIGGIFAVGAGIGLASLFKSPIEDALKFERAMLRLQNIGGITQATLQRVRGQALGGAYKGIGATESVDLFRDLHAAFGSADEAQKFMPQFATLARVTQGMYGKSAVGGEEDVRALAKFAERRGGTKDSASMGAALDLAMQIQNASGGAVGPKDLLQFMNRMGAMGGAMTNHGLLGMWALMQEQGGSKAATALNSGLQNLVNGRGTEKAGFWLHELGLVDEAKNGAMLTKLYGGNAGQHRNAVTANAIRGADLARADAPGYVEQIMLPALVAYAHKQGITDPKRVDAKIVELVSLMFSNRNGADSFALMASQLPRILKDRGIAENSGGLSNSAKNFDASPVSTFQALSAKWETTLVSLGEHALPVVVPLVEKLTSLLQRFIDYSAKNPGSVERWVKGIAALSAALIGFGAIAMVASGINAIVMASRLATVALGAGGLAGSIGLILAQAALLAGVAYATYQAATALGADKLGDKVGSGLYDLFHRDPNADANAELAKRNAQANFVRPGGRGSETQYIGSIVMDSHKVASVVFKHAAKDAYRPQTGTMSFDPTFGMDPAGG